MSLKFVPKGKINNKSALVEVMAWRRTGKPLSEPMLPSSQTHICGTRGRWIKHLDASCRTKLIKVKKNLVTSKMRNYLMGGWLPTNDKPSRNYHCFIACPFVTEKNWSNPPRHNALSHIMNMINVIILFLKPSMQERTVKHTKKKTLHREMIIVITG